MYRVMLADDEPIVRKALQTLIDWKRLGCEVVFVASNGREVLEHMEEEAPDILVTDIRMPGADGIALVKYVKEHELPVQVIILTAYADFSYAQAAVKYGAADYVTKTGALDGLESAVSRCCSQLEKSGGRKGNTEGKRRWKTFCAPYWTEAFMTRRSWSRGTGRCPCGLKIIWCFYSVSVSARKRTAARGAGYIKA